MIRPFSVVVRSVLACALGLLAACASDIQSPSAIIGPSSGSQGAIIRGQLDGATSSGGVTSQSTQANIRVSIIGTPLVTTTDASGRFVLTGVPSGRVQLRFEGPGVDARLEISGLVEGQQLEITIRLSGSQAVVVSPRPPDDDDDDGEVEFEGSIQSLAAPNLVVSGRSVTTDGATRFLDDRGRTIAFGDLRVGDRVEVEGRPLGAGVLATKIKIDD